MTDERKDIWNDSEEAEEKKSRLSRFLNFSLIMAAVISPV